MDLLPDEVNDWQKAQARWVLNVPHNLYLKSIEIALFRNFSSSAPRLEIGGAGGDTTNLAFNNQIIDLDLEYFSQSIFDQHDAGGDIFLATNAHICGGTYNMPLADESFQSVQMVHILDHLTDVNITFSELSRVLRPGGKLIVTTYSASVFRHLWLFRIIRKINTRWADIYYQLRTRATGLINGDPKDATGQNLLTIAEWKNIGWSYGLNLIHTQPFNYGAIWTNMLDLQKRGDPRFFRKILISIVGYAVNKELVKRGVMLEEDAANIFMVFEKPAAL
jgi:SAM-dependent methyltransferase